MADLVLANQQIMSQILSALGQCNSSAMAMIIGASRSGLSFSPVLFSEAVVRESANCEL